MKGHTQPLQKITLEPMTGLVIQWHEFMEPVWLSVADSNLEKRVWFHTPSHAAAE